MDPLVPVDQLEVFADGLDHAEGIAVTADGTVYVGGEAGQLYRIGADDSVEQVLTTGGFMLGLAADGAGRIYACDAAKKGVWRIDPLAGTMEVFCEGTAERPMLSPNWVLRRARQLLPLRLGRLEGGQRPDLDRAARTRPRGVDRGVA